MPLHYTTLMYRYHLQFDNIMLYENLWDAENKIIILLTLFYHPQQNLYHRKNVRIKENFKLIAPGASLLHASAVPVPPGERCLHVKREGWM